MPFILWPTSDWISLVHHVCKRFFFFFFNLGKDISFFFFLEEKGKDNSCMYESDFRSKSKVPFFDQKM